VFFTSLLASIGQWLGPNQPFQGKELSQLQATSTFLTAALTALGSGLALSFWIKSWSAAQLQRVVILTVMALLGVLTVRTAIRANYINYDNAMEYLVYAHMARGPKEALEQIEELSLRTTDGLALRVAYDDETTYPYWWYLRNYTNKDFFGKNPTRAQRDAVAILVGDANYGKIEPVVGQAYYAFEYTRIWWPNQDYFGLTWQRVLDALSDPGMRNAIFQVWLNRDFTQYGLLTNQDLSLPNWQPSHKFRLYIRKDVLNSLWNYGAAPTEAAVVADPYEGKEIKLTADLVVGTVGSESGQFKRPRGIAAALDGSIYIADTENHRIQHLAADGSVLQVWGGFSASTETTKAGEGLFNEPWGVAVGPDGSVYVADTWNHRIQKFTSDGKFVKTWGFGISQTDDPFGFYGPRAVAVNAQGQVLVTDTGNKRIVVFDSDGNFLTKFGETGFGPGQFDEPVGLAVDAAGVVYVADTWNQRIQVFAPSADGSYQPANRWDVAAWYGQSLDNKPYIGVDQSGHLFVADPEAYRILEFTTKGDFVQFWGDYGTGPEGFDLPSAVTADPDGGVWVSDTNNGRIMHFTFPNP
jgi:DNA-binding beta-propeller fold protein YncE